MQMLLDLREICGASACHIFCEIVPSQLRGIGLMEVALKCLEFAGKIHGSFLPIRHLMWLSYVTVLNYLLCLSVYLNPNQDTGCSVKATWIDIFSKIKAIPLRNFSTLRHKKFYIPSCIAAIMNQGKREWESEWEREGEVLEARMWPVCRFSTIS